MSLLAAKTPPISQEVFQRLRKVFPGPRVGVTANLDQIKWDEAQKQVVDWIEREYAGNMRLTVEEPEPPKPEPVSWWRKLLNRFWRK